MVIHNIATKAEIANRTRGEVTKIVFDTREQMTEPREDGTILLQYPPAIILFKPDIKPKEHFEGLPEGIIPITPCKVTFTIITPDKKKTTVQCQQFTMTPAYAFTDYKAQGQTTEYVIVNIAKPVMGGPLMLFNAYIALSRSRGHNTI